MDKMFKEIGYGSTPEGGLDYNDEGDKLSDYHARIRAMIEDARDFNDSILAEIREENTRYYKGDEPYLDEEGRSTIVATEVRDTVMAIMPSMMRIFTSHEHVVEFMPRREDAVDGAAQATDYISYIFWEDNPGYLALHGAFKDGLIRRTGILTWDTVKKKATTVKRYKGIDKEQVALILEANRDFKKQTLEPSDSDPDEFAMEGEDLFDLSLTFEEDDNIIKIIPVAPDEFRVDRNAKSKDSAALIGYEMLIPGSELIAQGYDAELVNQYRNSSSGIRWNEERSLRNPGLDMSSGRDSNDGDVAYGEYYVRIDQDGDGIAELHLICTMGDNDEIVNDEIVDRVKYAIFCPEPEPHTVIGESTAELVKDLQKIKTGILRSSLDSMASTIYPRLVVNQSVTNMDDVLNDEVGAPIRTKGSPADSVRQLDHQFIGEAAFGMLGYLDQVRQSRTGISDASKGLDPKALQSTNVKGVDMVITGAQERIELIARNFCETGMKDLFKGLLQEVTESPPKERIVRLRDKFVTIRPDEFDATMDVRVNPAIGRGTDMDRMMILGQVKQTQEMIITQMGVSNPLVGPDEYRNTMADLLAIANIKNVSRYFKAIDPQALAALQQNLNNKKDPATMLAEAEMEKIRAETAKAVGKQNFEKDKLEVEDEFRRDKLEVDATVELIKAGVSMDMATGVEETKRAIAGDQNVISLMDHHLKSIADERRAVSDERNSILNRDKLTADMATNHDKMTQGERMANTKLGVTLANSEADRQSSLVDSEANRQHSLMSQQNDIKARANEQRAKPKPGSR